MSFVLTDEEARVINNLSPGFQVSNLGFRLKAALDAEFPEGSISTAELAAGAVTEEKIAAGAVTSGKIAKNAVTLAKLNLGMMIAVAVSDGRVMSQEENVDALTSSIALANALKAAMNAHAADATEHTTSADTINFPVTTANATNLATLLSLTGGLLTAYDAHDADAELASGWAFHKAQEAGDHSLVTATAPTTLQEAVTVLNDLKLKYNAHDADSSCHNTGSNYQVTKDNAGYGGTNLVPIADVLSGDEVVWAVTDGGTGSVTGVTALAQDGGVEFTFSANPQNDAIITFAVFRPTS